MATINLTVETPEEASRAVNKMYRDGELFMSRWNALVSIAPYVRGTPLEGRFMTLMQKGQVIRQRIDKAHGAIRDVYAKAGQIIAASWVRMREYLGEDSGGVAMNLLPEFPGSQMAVATGASAASLAMLGWAREADQFIAAYNGEVRSTAHTTGTPINTLGELPQRTMLEKVGLPSIDSLGRLALIGGAVWVIGKWRKWW